jgi:hypothetical protein
MTDGLQGRRYTSQQKTGFVLLLIFAFLVIGLGFLQMRNNIYKFFITRAPKTEDGDFGSLVDEQTRLQTEDTDHDGLSDYDELNMHGTSPYLPDTDSDGLPDKKELEDGTDPNCPEGKSCAALMGSDVNTSTTTISSPLASDANAGLDLLQQFGQKVKDTAAANAQFVSNGQVDRGIADLLKDAGTLRAQILATGKVSKEALDKIDDATLLNMARNLLNSEQAKSQTNQGAVSGTSSLR